MLEAVDDLQSRLAAALVGRYTVEHEIGRGGMSIVFVAYDANLDRRVAIKVLRPELSAALGPDRFLREIKVAARLRHPFILKLHESGEARGVLYYIMPFVEGESLRQRLAHERTLPVAEALRIAQEVAEALDHAHRQNLIHRDIKPENILFEEGHALVSDFGIARAISAAGERETVPGIVLGTVDYMSPEQEQGRAELDGRTDIYSLGLVLYEMLIGETPGPDRAVDSLTGRRPDVPVAVVRLLRTALARDPADRFATAREFADALMRITRRPVVAGSLWRRWRTGVAVVTAAGLAVVIWIRTHQGQVSAALDPTHIAVLYFDDLSADRKIPEVSTGLTEDLIDNLGQVPQLRVTSANGVRPYRGTSLPLDSIARVLNVGTIVTGRVIRWQERLRVSVRLIDALSGVQLRSQTVERPWSDLLVIRDTIVEDVAVMLRERLGQEVHLRQRRADTRSPEAWQLIQGAERLRLEAAGRLRGRDLEGSASALRAADSMARTAATIDRQWSAPALTRARLAVTRALLIWEQGHASRRPGELIRIDLPTGQAFAAEVQRGVNHANAVLAADLWAPEALEIRGRLRWLLWSYFRRPADDTLRVAAERDLLDAVRQDSNLAVAWFTLSELYRRIGRLDQADVAARRALDADAYLEQAPSVIANLFFSALSLEQWDDARAWCARGMRYFPTRTNFIDCKLRILGWTAQGRSAIAEAWQALDAAERRDSSPVLRADRRMMVAAVLARSNLGDSARAVLTRTRATITDPYVRIDMSFAEAYVRLLLGERDEALRLLSEYLGAHPQARGLTAHHPWWRPLRADSRFMALVRSAA
jgi:eukaryotic-like serine/threonine-protein kinase